MRFLIIIFVLGLGWSSYQLKGEATTPAQYFYKSRNLILVAMNNVEIFKDVVGYEGLYKVSNLGRIKRMSRTVYSDYRNRVLKEVILKQSDSFGYRRVVLNKNGQLKQYFVHRIVAMAFIGDNGKFTQINHINGIKHDNRPINLEWTNQSENQKHAYRIGLQKPTKPWLNKKGYENHSSKELLMISTKTNEIICKFGGSHDAARNLHIKDGSLIRRAARGERKSAYGYKWKYA